MEVLSITTAPNFSACFLNSKVSSFPFIPSGNPGKFSIISVVEASPPAGPVSITRVFIREREVYMADVSPAGPAPRIITS